MPYKPTGRKSGQRGGDIAANVRGAFLRAAKMCEEDGRPLSLIIQEQLLERPLDTLRTIAQFVPKEMLVEADITSDFDGMTDAAIASYARRLSSELGIAIGVAGTEEATH